MVKPAECQQMRDIMKQTARKMAKCLFIIFIFCLGLLLLWRVSDLTLNYLSHQAFVKSNNMFFVIAGLCLLMTITSVFFFWCSWDSASLATKHFNPSDTFISLGMIFMVMPLVIGAILWIFSVYFPGGNLPYGLNVAMKATFCYEGFLLLLVFLFWACVGISGSGYY